VTPSGASPDQKSDPSPTIVTSRAVAEKRREKFCLKLFLGVKRQVIKVTQCLSTRSAAAGVREKDDSISGTTIAGRRFVC
jgi:hypothetical protein